MRYSEFFINTLKEEPSDSEIESYSLCLRSGLIRKIASGIYAFMPLGFRILKKIENIVRQEMNRAGAIEMLMPAMQPADLWIKSERWFEYGPEMFRLKDRSERYFCLGPTHEELITYLAFLDIKSYKELPVNLYQIQVKFRDEIRPRYGILRAREFIMKDAYSFSANEEDLDTIYNKMYECYSRILDRLNLKYFAVEADSGLIGGRYSHEFIILSNNGEDRLVYCPSCGFSANYEMAGFARSDEKSQSSSEEIKLSEVHTPGTTNIKSLSEFLKVPAESIIKTMLLKDSQGTIIAVLLRGDKELNLTKCEKLTGKKLELLSESGSADNFNIGFLGPVNLDTSIDVFADYSIKGKKNLIAGANRQDYHLTGVNYPRDFKVFQWGDFTFPAIGDLCINCKNELNFEKGIEIGHIFKLGTKYSEKMDAMFLDKDGKLKPFIMGCYGIGVSRIMAAVVEQLFDERGIIWPISIAPFLVNLIAINMEDESIFKASEDIYSTMLNNKIDVLYDERNVRAGIKFKDSDLIGIPLKVIVGKNYIENKKLEIEIRKDRSKLNLSLEETLQFIKDYKIKNIF
ncbi:MAG: proline--tRNA ligase [Actinobacteria bacterium]|nr:proline--tRNA ligase [Actinomycetota bacterium]